MSGDFNRFNTHGHMRAQVSAERSRVQAIVSQLKGMYDAEKSAGVPTTSKMEREATPEAVTVAAVPVPATSGITEKLKELAALKESGALTEEEFTAAKAAALREATTDADKI